jgi:hypothetical protein
MQGFCVKCSAKRDIVGGKESTIKNGNKMLKGKCAKCGTTVCRILGKK